MSTGKALELWVKVLRSAERTVSVPPLDITTSNEPEFTVKLSTVEEEGMVRLTSGLLKSIIASALKVKSLAASTGPATASETASDKTRTVVLMNLCIIFTVILFLTNNVTALN